ncbi:hypothetical protein Tco_0942456 [Tanacetum coccineum]
MKNTEVKKPADQKEIENVKDEERKNVKDQQVSERTINETADTITSLQSEVASLDAKGSLDANEIKKDHTRVHELEKQVEKLPMELQLKNNFREATETTSKDLEKKMLDENPTLHDPQKVAFDQKKKHYKTNEVASLDAKGSLDVNKEIKKDHTRVHELEKQVEKLPIELQLKNNFREATETTPKDLEKKMLDLNPTLHDPQKVAIDKKKKHYKTKYALKINDELFKNAKSEATTKIRKLAKVYDAWLPPWLVAHLVVFQLYVKNHSKEFLFIQGRIWDPRIKRIFKTSP